VSCRHCGRPLSEAPSRACAGCADRLHLGCWAQLSAAGVRGCGHESQVVGVAFLDDERLLSVDSAGFARLWRLKTGEDTLLVLAGEPVRQLLTGAKSEVFVLQGDSLLSVRRASDAGQGKAINPGLGYLAAGALAADGSRLVVGSGGGLVGCDPRAEPLAFKPLGEPLPDSVVALALCPDGGRAAALLSTGSIVLRDAEFGFDLAVSPPLQGASRQILGHSCNALIFSEDGARLVVGAGAEIFVLDGLTAQLERRVEVVGAASALLAPVGGLLWVDLLRPEGAVVCELDASGVRERGAYQGPVLPSSCARLGSRRRAAVGSEDGTVLVIDVEYQCLAEHLEGHHNARWLLPSGASRRLWVSAPAAPQLLAVGASGVWCCSTADTSGVPAASLLARDTGRQVASRPLEGWPTALLATAGDDGGDRVVALGSELRVVGEGGPVFQSAEVRGYDGLPLVAWGTGAASGRPVALCDAWGLVIEALDEQGARRWQLDRPSLTPLAGRSLGVDLAGHLRVLLKPSGAGLFDLGVLDDRGALALPRSIECPVNGEAEVGWLTPDGVHALISRLAPADDRKTEIGLFDLDRGVFVASLASGHRAPIRDMALSPTGTLLATCSLDLCTRVWSLPSGRQIAAFSSPSPLRSVRFGLDGATLYGFRSTGEIEAWDLGGLDPRSEVFGALHRAQQGDTLGRRALLARLRLAAEQGDAEALAGLLLFRRLYPRAWSPEPEAPWLASAAGALAADFDRRLRALAPTSLPLNRGDPVSGSSMCMDTVENHHMSREVATITGKSRRDRRRAGPRAGGPGRASGRRPRGRRGS